MFILYIMPYFLRKVAGGWKACDSAKCFSKNPLTKRGAEKQRIAIALSEHKKKPNVPMSYFFK